LTARHSIILDKEKEKEKKNRCCEDEKLARVELMDG